MKLASISLPASLSTERCRVERRLSVSRLHSISDRSGYQALQEAIMLTINIETVRRFILGKQGLWPGRCWRGIEGTRLPCARWSTCNSIL
jgi:hypothetical protein